MAPKKLQSRDSDFKEILEKTNKENTIHLSQLGNRSGQSAILSRLLSDLPGNHVFIAREEKEARSFEMLFSFWLKGKGIPVFRLTDPPEPALYAAIQQKGKIIIITHIELLRSAYPDRTSYVKTVEHLEVGERRSPLELSQRLLQHGYVFEEAATEPGTIARRGNIVDVHPVHDNELLRVEFEDNAIATITKTTGEKRERIKTLHIPPARLSKGSVSFWSIWPEKPTLIYEDSEGEEHPLWKDLENRDGFKRIIIYPFKTEHADVIGVHAAPLYHSDITGAVKALKQKKKDGWDVQLYETGGQNRLAHFAKNRLRWNTAPKRAPELLEGFMVELTHELHITDKELFGKEKIPGKSSNNILEQAFLSNLEEGDYVVHADHGVGKFTGMKTNVIDEVAHEYFLLEYAEQDKLYVPVENADKLTKYLGTEQPKVHRLSGTSWKAITQKIKEEARILAKELLELYAQRSVAKAPSFSVESTEERRLRLSFPYEETEDQTKAIQDIARDLQKERPMDRLICGDVGFGKTEVAIRAAYKVMSQGFQVALLSPTTILTQQHFDTFQERLKDSNVKIANLSRFQTRAEQDIVVRDIQTGNVDIVIGTHRLLSEDVRFKKLGLVVIDEEQRFGVKHKEQLKKLRTETHVLTLSATPIPRTLNIALSGIRDISLIETPPEGRLPIETIIEPYTDLLVKDAIKKEFERKGQVYYLYNKVETIALAAQRLQRLLPQARIGIAHGQLDEETLSHVMSDFDNRKTNILVCSTIIENGLDLPNVNTIIVENATKFGLAQLYQLRGRVGRGLRQAYAYFLYGSQKLTGNAKKRLQSLLEARELGSGFQLALRDLEIRGVGNILGKEQHGKVSAVGLALYSRLLAQAVDEIKTGRRHKEFRDILIDLPLSIGILNTYIAKESSRLELYQKLAGITKTAVLHQTHGLMIEAYGKPPQETKNLYALLKLRIEAQTTDISRIESKKSAQGDRLSISFTPSINPQMIPELLELNDSWTFTQEQIKIQIQKLSDNWFADLETVIALAKKYRLTSAEKKSAKKALPAAESKAS